MPYPPAAIQLSDYSTPRALKRPNPPPNSNNSDYESGTNPPPNSNRTVTGEATPKKRRMKFVYLNYYHLKSVVHIVKIVMVSTINCVSKKWSKKM